MLFVGEKELDSEVYPLKNTISGEEKQLSVARIVSTIRDHRQRGEEEFDIASEE